MSLPKWLGVIAAASAMVAAMLALTWQLSALLYAAEGPDIPQGAGDSCVAETDYMRRNHMDLIVHQRDETVLRGIRDEPFSLVECVDCHVQQDDKGLHVRIDSEGQFCASCHAYAAVKIDCFSCHAAVPDTVSGEMSQARESSSGASQ